MVTVSYSHHAKRDMPRLLAPTVTLMKTLVALARAGGALRGDRFERYIVFALIRFARPLAVGLPVAEERALAHRHLDFHGDGLCAADATPGPAS